MLKKINWGIVIIAAILLPQILFICMKVNDAIKWSWWWVMSPLLITVAIVVVSLLLIVFAMKEPDELDPTELQDYYIEKSK